MQITRLLPLAALAATVTAHAQFSIDNFATSTPITRIGSTIIAGSSVVLTPRTGFQVGGAWHREKQSVADGFSTTFRFRLAAPGGISDVDGTTGADGFAFVIQNAGPGALGAVGQGLGYEGIANSVAVEFDTWSNGHHRADPNSLHISVQTRGIEPNSAHHQYSLGVAPSIPTIEDGNEHTAQIEYRDRTLTVRIDGAETPILSVPIDLSTRLRLDNGRAWVGFTGATGSAWQRIEIARWSFDVGVDGKTGIR